mgnify:CR=1 FL=1
MEQIIKKWQATWVDGCQEERKRGGGTAEAAARHRCSRLRASMATQQQLHGTQ